MNKNKYHLSFNQSHEGFWLPEYITNKLDIQNKMKVWCEENIGDEGFPRWQFTTNLISTSDPSGTGIVNIELADGIFILDDALRSAFRLTFI